jgi:hypothetical protein
MRKDERYEALLREIRERLRPVCRNMPEDQFETMVEDIATNARKSELRAHSATLDVSRVKDSLN